MLLPLGPCIQTAHKCKVSPQEIPLSTWGEIPPSPFSTPLLCSTQRSLQGQAVHQVQAVSDLVDDTIFTGSQEAH